MTKHIYRYGLIGLLSLSALVVTSDRVFTQQTNDQAIAQTDVSSSLIWPTQGIISQGFRKRQHEGIDIAGPSGTPIFAAASGRVIQAGWDDSGLGKAIAISHRDGRVTVYGHNQSLLVSKGQTVTQGQIIAKMGSTGNSTGPHLHFEVYPNGKYTVDPMGVLPSLVAGRIPSHRIVTSTSGNRTDHFARNIRSDVVRQQVSPSQSIPILVAPPENSDTECSGETVIEGETGTLHVKVCYENGQFYYIGQLKQDPNRPIKIPAWSIGKHIYQADNGSFSYVVSPQGVEVWRDGSPIRSDSFDRPKVSGG